MTHRTVPLDLLVRVRDALMAYHALRVNPLRIGELETLMDDLTAQIEQQQDSVPAWAKQKAFADWARIVELSCDSVAALGWIESRALALAQTKG